MHGHGRCIAGRVAVGASEYDRLCFFAKMQVGEEWNGRTIGARDLAEMKGVVARIISVREPFGIVNYGGNSGR